MKFVNIKTQTTEYLLFKFSNFWQIKDVFINVRDQLSRNREILNK